MEKLARIASWCLLLAIVVFTDGPIGLRPTTPFSPNTERFAALFAVGFVFALGYMQHPKRVLVFLLGAVCLFEVLQNLTPGRHAGVADVMIKMTGAYLGLIAGRIFVALLKPRDAKQE